VLFPGLNFRPVLTGEKQGGGRKTGVRVLFLTSSLDRGLQALLMSIYFRD